MAKTKKLRREAKDARRKMKQSRRYAEAADAQNAQLRDERNEAYATRAEVENKMRERFNDDARYGPSGRADRGIAVRFDQAADLGPATPRPRDAGRWAAEASGGDQSGPLSKAERKRRRQLRKAVRVAKSASGETYIALDWDRLRALSDPPEGTRAASDDDLEDAMLASHDAYRRLQELRDGAETHGVDASVSAGSINMSPVEQQAYLGRHSVGYQKSELRKAEAARLRGERMPRVAI